MDITAADVIVFVTTYKWWFFALLPFAIVIVVLKMRG